MKLNQLPALLALLAVAAPAVADPLAGTLYKDQNCPCCVGHARYLEEKGLQIEVRPVTDIAAVSQAAGMPADYQGCHTLMLEGYAIEGHVAIEIIEKLLRERPADVIGISLPGMPTGVPGMDGPDLGPYEVYAIHRDGTATVFAEQ